jgi:hypothetical protein
MSRIVGWLAGGLLVVGVAACGSAGLGHPAGREPAVAARGNNERVMGLERQFWAAEKRHDATMVADLLAPDYVYLSSRGRGDRGRGDELALLTGGRTHLEEYEFTNMRAVSVAPGVIALHYLVTQRFTLDGRAYCPHSGSMTLWARRGDRWLRSARTEYVIADSGPVECSSH